MPKFVRRVSRFHLDSSLPRLEKELLMGVLNIELKLSCGFVQVLSVWTPDRSLTYVVLGLGLVQLSVVYERLL